MIDIVLPLKCKNKCFSINLEVGLLTLLANYQLCVVQFKKSESNTAMKISTL